MSGPVPLPTKKEIVTTLRAVPKYKDSREQFEQRTHKRLIDIITPTPKTVDALQRLEMPSGVYIDIKKTNKDFGPALIGIELSAKEDFSALMSRMDSNGISYEYINENNKLFEILI